MAEAEQPERRDREVTVDDVRQLMGVLDAALRATSCATASAR